MSDLGEGDGGDSLENTLLLSEPASSIQNRIDLLPAVDIGQHFEQSRRVTVYKPSSDSLDYHIENKKSSRSSSIMNVSGEDINLRNDDVDFNRNLELDVVVGDGGTKKMDCETALLDDETHCLSPSNVDKVNSSEKKGREGASDVAVESCLQSAPMEEEVTLIKEDEVKKDEGILPNEHQLQSSEPTQALQIVALENCLLCVPMEDEVKEDEGILPTECQLQTSEPTQALQSVPLERDNDVRVDCSHHFKTDKVFRTKEEVLDWAKLQGRQSGSVLTIKKSQEAKRGRAPRLYLRCERGGKYESHGGPPPKGLRKTGTKKCACPFELGTTWSRVGEKEWKIKVFVRNGIHNHELAKFKEGHTHAGKLTKKELDIVADMSKAGAKPREILDALRKNDPGNCTSLHQIYNALHAIRSKDMDGKIVLTDMDGKNHLQRLPKALNDDSVDFNCNLKLIKDVSDGDIEKMNFETRLPDNETCGPSPPKVDRVDPTEEKGTEDVMNMDVESCISIPPIEDELIPPKEDEVKEDEGNYEGGCMRRVGQLPGDLLSDVGKGHGEDSLGNSSLLSAFTSSIPNPKDAIPAVHVSQQFEISDFNPNLELDVVVGHGGTKKMDCETALPNDRTCCLSPPKVVENCLPSPPIGDELILLKENEVKEDKGVLPNECQLQTSEPIPLLTFEKDGELRVDCSPHFKTDKEFRTKEEVLHWAKLQGRQTGTVLTIKKSQAPKRGRAPRLYLKCERGGKYESSKRPPPKGIGKTGTKKCACPFELGTTWSRAGEKEWKIKVFVRNGIHNHELVKFSEGHGYAGKLTKQELDFVADMRKAGVRPREILDALRKNDPGNSTSLHQIYNAIHAIKTKNMDRKNQMQLVPDTPANSHPEKV